MPDYKPNANDDLQNKISGVVDERFDVMMLYDFSYRQIMINYNMHNTNIYKLLLLD